MTTTQTNAQQNRIQVRLPDALMRQVAQRTGPNGLYADSSDYVRDLIRKDAETEHDDFYQELIHSLNSPTQELEDNFFEELRRNLEKKRNAKAKKQQ